jgi:hypothetical protein
MEFPATGSGIMAATVLLQTGPAMAPGSSNEDFAAFAIVDSQNNHIGDYIGIVSNAPATQTGGTLQPGEAGLRWNHVHQWPQQFSLHAVQALGVEGQATIPGLSIPRDNTLLSEPWIEYDYSAIFGVPTTLPASGTVQAEPYGLLYRMTFPPDASGASPVGYLHARAVSAPDGGRDLEWYVPSGVLTPGRLTNPPEVRRHLIDLRPVTLFELVTGTVQVGGLVKHVDAVKPLQPTP